MKSLIDKIGIVGGGKIGKVYFDILKSKGVSQILVADPAPSFNSPYPKYSDYRRLPECDGIIIALPTEMHGEAIRAFLKRKTCLLVEKGIGATLKESKEIHEEIKESKLNVMCGLTGLYHPEFQAMYKNILRIGNLVEVEEQLHEASRYLINYLTSERGVLTSNGFHTIHRFLKIASLFNLQGDFAMEKVKLSKKYFPEARGEDSGEGILRILNIPFRFNLSFRKDECDNGLPIEYWIKIRGDKGEIKVIGWESCELRTNGNKEKPYEHPEGHLNGQSQYSRIPLGLEKQIDEFLEFIKSESKEHPTLQESLRTQEVLERIYEKAI